MVIPPPPPHFIYQSQVKLACNKDVLTCSKSAACLGGLFSNERLPVKNKLYLAPLTDKETHVLLYTNTTNRSMRSICTLSRVKKFRIVSKGNQCLCHEYFATHSSHSSCHSSKCEILYHNLLRSEAMGTLMTLMGLAGPSRNVSIAFATTKLSP